MFERLKCKYLLNLPSLLNCEHCATYQTKNSCPVIISSIHQDQAVPLNWWYDQSPPWALRSSMPGSDPVTCVWFPKQKIILKEFGVGIFHIVDTWVEKKGIGIWNLRSNVRWFYSSLTPQVVLNPQNWLHWFHIVWRGRNEPSPQKKDDVAVIAAEGTGENDRVLLELGAPG